MLFLDLVGGDLELLASQTVGCPSTQSGFPQTCKMTWLLVVLETGNLVVHIGFRGVFFLFFFICFVTCQGSSMCMHDSMRGGYRGEKALESCREFNCQEEAAAANRS